ncbi:MAG TPA: type IV pilus biogenesis/stability protein PilW [Solimonas sp.]|nr:type IV pilus biogenesis/stability protein PilW [Solimonas sp.]
MRSWLALLAAVLALAGCVSTGRPSDANLVEAARINTELGIDYMRKGQMEPALEKLKRAIGQDPNNSVAQSAIAYVYQTRSEPELAEKHYRQALALDAENADARNNFGVFLCGRGEYAEADKYFLKAAQDPKYTTPDVAYTNAGVCAKSFNATKAENYFRKALEANPKSPDALAQLASIAFRGKDYLRTRAFLQRFEAVGKPTAEMLWIGAQTEREMGDDLAARKYELRLRREFPDSAEAANLDKPRE